MKFLFVLCIATALSCSVLGVPEQSTAAAVLSRSPRNLLESLAVLVQNLVDRLAKAGSEALEAVKNFTEGIIKEAQEFRDKITNNIASYQKQITTAIGGVFQKISDTNSAVSKCVDNYRDQAANLFNNTSTQALACVDEGIDGVSVLIKDLRTLATEAIEGASLAVAEMKQCTKEGTNMLSTGSCLGTVASRVEMKTINLLSQSTLLIGRINLSFATLPASLEVCAGTRLVQTGLETSKIFMNVGTCSASVVFNSLSGRE